MATPRTAATVRVPSRAAFMEFPLRLMVTGLLELLSTSPLLSTILTDGAGLTSDPVCVVVGWVLKTRWPGLMVKLADEAALLTSSATAIALIVWLAESENGEEYKGELAEAAVPSVV